MTGSALANRLAGERDLASTAAIALASLAASLLCPPLALLLAWVGVLATARDAPEFSTAPLLAFAHAGALMFASRSFEDASSDFVNYFGVYGATCAGTAPLEDNLLAFGLELGLPLFYRALSLGGLCGLSINGLAYLQGFITSAAALLVVAGHALRETPARDRALAMGGLCLMFSFFYATQLSRQALSSVFVLAALWHARRPRAALLCLGVATLFHLTAPLIYGLALALRGSLRRALQALVAVMLVSLVAFDRLVAFAVENVDAFNVLSKVAIYAVPVDDGVGPMSDLLSVLLLAFAGALLTLKSRSDERLRSPSRLLLGFALVGLAVLPIPLAATRLTLPLAWIAGGYYVLRGLAGTARPLAWFALLALLLLRLGLTGALGDSEHALWNSYPPASWMPGYFLSAF